MPLVWSIVIQKNRFRVQWCEHVGRLKLGRPFASSASTWPLCFSAGSRPLDKSWGQPESRGGILGRSLNRNPWKSSRWRKSSTGRREVGPYADERGTDARENPVFFLLVGVARDHREPFSRWPVLLLLLLSSDLDEDGSPHLLFSNDFSTIEARLAGLRRIGWVIRLLWGEQPNSEAVVVEIRELRFLEGIEETERWAT